MLLRWGAERLARLARPVPHRVDAVGLQDWATALADDLADPAAIPAVRLYPALTM